MANGVGSTHGIRKFDGTYFAFWRMQIEDYLYDKKLYLPFLGMKPEGMLNDNWVLD